jgi:integrase
MGLYRRGKFHWISYAIPKDMAAQFGCARTIRESTGTGTLKDARAFLKKRQDEIENGTWRPSTSDGATLTLAGYVERWSARRNHRELRSAKRDLEVLAPFLATLGHRRIDSIARPDIRMAVDAFRDTKGKRGKAKGKTYAPMTIHRHYGLLRACFRAAVREGLITVNPCTLTTIDEELPKRDDADIEWRDTAVFEREEIVMLITDERVPEIRRILYALTFFAGLRMGEAVGRKWGDYNARKLPLGQFKVATQHDGKRLKTDRSRKVPVHPTLALILAAWKERYALHYGAEPTDEDLIVRNGQGTMFLPNSTLQNLQRDLRNIGLRRRRFHDLRRSLISIAIDDGARGDILKVATHGQSKTIIDQYTSNTWKAVCEQFMCLKVELPKAPRTPPKRPPLQPQDFN